MEEYYPFSYLKLHHKIEIKNIVSYNAFRYQNYTPSSNWVAYPTHLMSVDLVCWSVGYLLT